MSKVYFRSTELLLRDKYSKLQDWEVLASFLPISIGYKTVLHHLMLSLLDFQLNELSSLQIIWFPHDPTTIEAKWALSLDRTFIVSSKVESIGKCSQFPPFFDVSMAREIIQCSLCLFPNHLKLLLPRIRRLTLISWKTFKESTPTILTMDDTCCINAYRHPCFTNFDLFTNSRISRISLISFSYYRTIFGLSRKRWIL